MMKLFFLVCLCVLNVFVSKIRFLLTTWIACPTRHAQTLIASGNSPQLWFAPLRYSTASREPCDNPAFTAFWPKDDSSFPAKAPEMSIGTQGATPFDFRFPLSRTEEAKTSFVTKVESQILCSGSRTHEPHVERNEHLVFLLQYMSKLKSTPIACQDNIQQLPTFLAAQLRHSQTSEMETKDPI